MAVLLAALGLFAGATVPFGMAHYYLLDEDLPVLVGLVGLLLVAALSRTTSAATFLPHLRLSRPAVIAIAAAMATLLWAGTYLLFDNYPLSRDEHMVLFDMAVFRNGRLAAPLAPEWRPYTQALTPEFLLSLPGNVAWVSAYMPGNAMLRTAFGAILDPALMNPIFAAVGALAVFDIAKRLFPHDASAQGMALLMYASSAQLVVTAMTPFAMTAHLALNLAWLALYLRGTRRCHAAAIGLGFIGIGLHQVIFHPLFALPFIERLRRNGQWRTAAIYVVSYAAFGLFWISYPHLVAISAGIDGPSTPGSGIGTFIADRVIPLLLHRDPETLPFTAANLIRFISWQNLALLPLMVVGMRAVRRDEGMARPLAYGILLTIVAMTILLPYQGHGWGYRYLHGLIGSCALLAAYGWRDFSARAEVRHLVGLGTLMTICWSLPFLLWQSHTFVHPYAEVNRMIDRTDADIAVVETDGLGLPLDMVRNDPDLRNRPIRLASSKLTTSDIVQLCHLGTVAFVDVRQMHALGMGGDDDMVSSHFSELQYDAESHCG